MKKNHVYKFQGREPIHQKYKVNKTQGYKMTINDNKEDLRR
jgi:hypothetical protein